MYKSSDCFKCCSQATGISLELSFQKNFGVASDYGIYNHQTLIKKSSIEKSISFCIFILLHLPYKLKNLARRAVCNALFFAVVGAISTQEAPSSQPTSYGFLLLSTVGWLLFLEDFTTLCPVERLSRTNTRNMAVTYQRLCHRCSEEMI